MASTLLLIPLDETVVFPTMDVTLPVDPGDAEQVLLVPRHDGEYARVGTVARVANRVRLPGGARGAHFEGVARGIAGAARPSRRSSRSAATTAASRTGGAPSTSPARSSPPPAPPTT